MIDVDPVGLVRGRPTAAASGGLVEAYVNDRPYVPSSLLSVAIARVFSTALGGRSDPSDLAERRLTLQATLSPIGLGDEALPARLFGPLGYEVCTVPVDVPVPERVDVHRTVMLAASTTLRQLLTHIYVLVPVLDGEKHYWVGDEEVEKLFRFGDGWFASHPERKFITRRFLKRAPKLARAALARLVALDDSVPGSNANGSDDREASLERPMRLQDRRISSVVEALRTAGATTVADVGCGEGDLIASLARETHIERVIGTDVAVRELFPALGEARLRHTDHRFEWTREGLRTWSERIAAQFGHSVDFKPIGDEDAIHGAPTQMAVVRCA